MKACVLIFIVLLINLSCKDESFIRNYPEIVSSEIVEITSAGVSVEAKIGENLRDKIVDHGFIWSRSRDLSIDTSRIVRLGKPTSDTFSYEIRSQLLAEKKYYLKAFLKSDTHVVYGTEMQFTSLGSEGPIIEDVSPETVVAGDLLTITGQRFGTDTKTTKVIFRTSTNDYPASIKTLKDTEIVVTVPIFLQAYARIVITTKENEPVVSSMTVERLLP